MQKLENLGIIGLLCCRVGNPHHGINLHQGVGYPHRSETEVPDELLISVQKLRKNVGSYAQVYVSTSRSVVTR